MPVITFSDFAAGLDLRKGASVSDANRLRVLDNCYVTTGKTIRKRPGLVLETVLEVGTKGLRAAGGKLNTFYASGTVTHADTRFLANKIAPEFLHDIRGVSWRRKIYTFSTEIGLQHYPMPPSFATCMSVRISGVERKLDYIGEDEQKIEAALDTTSQARPYQYWFEHPSNADIQS